MSRGPCVVVTTTFPFVGGSNTYIADITATFSQVQAFFFLFSLFFFLFRAPKKLCGNFNRKPGEMENPTAISVVKAWILESGHYFGFKTTSCSNLGLLENGFEPFNQNGPKNVSPMLPNQTGVEDVDRVKISKSNEWMRGDIFQRVSYFRYPAP